MYQRIRSSAYARDVRAHMHILTDTIAGVVAAYLFVMLLRLLGVVLVVGAR